MKTINNNFASKFALVAFLIVGNLVVTSCNKDNKQEIPTGNSKLIVSIAGIGESEIINVSGNKGSLSSAKYSSQNTAQNSIKIVEGNAFDAIVGVDNHIPSTNEAPISQAGRRTSDGLKAVSTPLSSTTTYRLYLYKNNGGTYTFTQSIQFTPGAETPIQVPNGSYKWVALSYNNTDALPDGASSSSIVLPANKDVLYASSGASDIVISDNTIPINITFNRVFAKITVEINTLGMFARMTENPTISVTAPNIIKTGTLNLTTGALSAISSGTNLSLTATDFTDISPVSGEAYQKVAYFYTAPQAQQTITAAVSNLKIKLDDGTIRDFGTATSNQVIQITPTAGKSQRALVGFSESALTRNTVKWSRSNLYYVAGDHPYRFFHTNAQTPASVTDPKTQASFFAFRGHLPLKFAKNNPALQKDPCALVYPANLWKTPTQTEIGSLTTTQGLLTNVLGNITSVLGLGSTPGASVPSSGNGYIDFTSTGQNAAYAQNGSQANTLRFQYNGVMVTLAAVEELITLNLGSTHDASSGFWSNQDINNANLGGALGGVVNLGAWGFAGRSARFLGLGPFLPFANQSLGVLNISVLNLIDVIQSPFMNVRCVRNPNWTTISQAAGYNPEPDLSNL